MRILLATAALLLATSACSPTTSSTHASPEGAGRPTRAAPVGPGEVTTAPLATPRPRDVLGHWRVVSVRGGPPPRHAVPGILLQRLGHRLGISWSDGVNEHALRWTLTPDGAFRTSDAISSLVGCVGRCARPSGFGVATATALRVTRGGRLVFLGRDGAVLATYRRAG